MLPQLSRHLTAALGVPYQSQRPRRAKGGEGFILVNTSIVARSGLNGLPRTVDVGLRGVALRLGGAHRFFDHRTCRYVSVTLLIGTDVVRSLGGLRRAANDCG